MQRAISVNAIARTWQARLIEDLDELCARLRAELQALNATA